MLVMTPKWKILLRKAWSIKFMVLAFFFTVAEVTLPFFSEAVPKNLFAIASGLAVAGAFVARLIAQKELKDDDHDDSKD